MDLLHTFVIVARSGGYSAAAKFLSSPRSTLSKRISRLEEQLGVTLLERTTRAVRLTEAGRRLYQRCAPAIETLEEASRAAREDTRRPRGTLRVSAPIDVRFFLEKVLPELRVRAPEVELELEITQRQVDLVREGFDLALRGSERLEDSSLVARKLMTQEFRLFASPFYLANRGVPKTHADLAAHDLIAFAPGMRVLPWDLRAKDERVKLTPRSWLRANELGVLQLAITQGLGIGMCDPVLVAKEVERGQLQRVLPEYAMPGGSLFAVYPSRRRVPAKVRVFLELLQLHLVAR